MGTNQAVDGIIDKILSPIMFVIETILEFVFSSSLVSVIVYVIIVNLIAFFLMKTDKKFAQNAQRRVRESTLIITAIAGGSVGIYFAMYKFKHKTLHDKFTILVPIIMMAQTAVISYLVFMNIFA